MTKKGCGRMVGGAPQHHELMGYSLYHFLLSTLNLYYNQAMLYAAMVITFLFVYSLARINADIDNKSVKLDVGGAQAVKQAEFAVKELQKLSDSGVYSIIKLAKIISAEEENGIYHYNTILRLELSSPYFKSGDAVETYEVVVMTHKEDSVKSIAINEFPVMDEDAIEQFYIAKVEERRKQREETFRRIELEALFLHEHQDQDQDLEPSTNSANQRTLSNTKIDYQSLKEKLSLKSIEDLLDIIDTPELYQQRMATSTSLQDRIPETQRHEEHMLSSLSLRQLYEISYGGRSGTDYQIYRARQILDNSILHMQDVMKTTATFFDIEKILNPKYEL